MGKSKVEQDAYNQYTLLLLKKFLKESMQVQIVVREEELAQSDHNEALENQYIGYRLALEDLYFNLYNEELPELQFVSTIEKATINVL